MKEKVKNQSDIVKDMVNRSGNNFHYKVVNFLRDRGWSVLVSPYYTDNLTDKPREIDIIAEKAFDVKGWSAGWMGTLNVKLFIECKYINSNNVFWFDTLDKPNTIERIMTDTPLEDPKKNITIAGHRYMAVEKVAKLFASEGKGQENNEVFYKAINQNLNALVYYKNKGNASIVPPQDGKRTNILCCLNYPLIVCNSFQNLFGIDVLAGDEPFNIPNNFHLEVNYAYLNNVGGNQSAVSEYFLVDVIDFRKFDDFITLLKEKDIEIIQGVLSR